MDISFHFNTHPVLKIIKIWADLKVIKLLCSKNQIIYKVSPILSLSTVACGAESHCHWYLVGCSVPDIIL